MAEREKNLKRLSAEEIAKVWKSMKGKPLPDDFDEFETPLSGELSEKLKQVLRRKRV